MSGMCCFSGTVSFVGSARIFGRFLDGMNQCFVDEMKLDAREELAMILPIPVVQPAKEDAVKFADLSGYPGFFKDLEKAFPAPQPFAAANGSLSLRSAPVLKVQRVGSFNASFVPTIADFSRLDAQFRLDNSVWKSLPRYKV